MQKQFGSMRNFSKSSPFEETVGDLEELTNVDGAIIAQIGKIALVLPPEMEHKLRPHLRSRIGILSTDIPGKRYLFRVIHGEKPDHEMESVASAVQAAATEMNARQCKPESVL